MFSHADTQTNVPWLGTGDCGAVTWLTSRLKVPWTDLCLLLVIVDWTGQHRYSTCCCLDPITPTIRPSCPSNGVHQAPNSLQSDINEDTERAPTSRHQPQNLATLRNIEEVDRIATWKPLLLRTTASGTVVY
jgi:hypothetical protein